MIRHGNLQFKTSDQMCKKDKKHTQWVSRPAFFKQMWFFMHIISIMG